MKTRFDPRHKKRVRRFKRLFAYSFTGKIREDDEALKPVVENVNMIDAKIQEVAPEWPVQRLNKVDLAILRLSVYELLRDLKTPPKVIIDEAVEIGKEYGSESTAKFVNGVLGTLLEQSGRADELKTDETEEDNAENESEVVEEAKTSPNEEAPSSDTEPAVTSEETTQEPGMPVEEAEKKE